MPRRPAPKLDLAAREARQKAEKDFRYYNVKRFILHPGQWAHYAAGGTPLTWQRVQFSVLNRASVPNNEVGIYSFVVEPSIANHPSVRYLVYIGKTDRQDFRTRYDQYLAEPEKVKRREHIAQMVEKWPTHLWFYYATLPPNTDITAVEDALLAAFIPPHNHQFPADIRRTVRRAFE